MAYQMAAYRTLIVLLCVVIVSEAKNLEGEGVCPALVYWNLKLPNTSIPNALRKAICPHTIAHHLFPKNIEKDVKEADVSISSQENIASGGGDITVNTHKYVPSRGGDATLSSQKYIPSRGGFATLSSQKYIPFKGGDVTVSSQKYISSRGGDVTVSSQKYIPSRGGDAALSSQKYIPFKGGDVTVSSQKYIPSRGGDVTVSSQKYIPFKGGDITVSSQKYIPSKGGDITVYSNKYITPQRGDVSISYIPPQGTEEALYNHIIDRDSSQQPGDITIGRDPNQENLEYHRKLLVLDPLLSIFFFEKDLHIQTNLMVYLEALQTYDSVGFIPRSMADKIPFSLEKLPIAQDMLNIPQGSHLSVSMKNTLKKCESPSTSGEKTFCTTSLESMIDSITTKFGSKFLNVLATNIPRNFKSENHQYTITAMFSKSNSSSKRVICHNLVYPYAIYMCHEAKGTKIFELSLKSQEAYGHSIPVVAICHADTSGWNPGHAAFVALNVKPGEEGICHFMLEGTIAWILSN